MFRKKKKAAAVDEDTTVAIEEMPDVAPDDQVKWLQRNGFLDFLGAYDMRTPMMKSTTRQTAGLHLAIAAAPTSAFGLIVGEDTMTGWPVFHDEIEGYRQKVISSPNLCAIGDIGAGKSSFFKTWGVFRHLLLGRRVVVIDKKMQAADDPDRDHEGEYAQLSRALGIEPIRFTDKEGGTRINPLDPAITGAAGLAAGQTVLLKAIISEIIDRDLTAFESKALRVAHATAVSIAAREDRDPTVVDVVEALLAPDPKVVTAQRGTFTPREFQNWGSEIGLALEETLEGDLQGLIDGPTSTDVRLSAGLTVFDISALRDDGPAVPVVMAIISTWIRNTIVSQREIVPTLMLVEEGWHLVNGSFAKVSQQNTKKSRGLAFATGTAYQHLSDVPDDSPAIATIKEAGTALLFRQARRDDAEHCQRLFGLPPQAVGLLMNLPTGCALALIGSEAPIMLRTLRSPIEAQYANTDNALLSAAQLELTASEAAAAAAEEAFEYTQEAVKA